MHKIVFLDVDGVLNNAEFMRDDAALLRAKKLARNAQPSMYHYYRAMINPIKVALLKQLLDATGAKIVVSSSWRGPQDIPSMRALMTELKRGGITAHSVIGITPPEHMDSLRGNEIRHWILDNADPREHRFKDYVILDDDSDILYEQREHFVHTDCRVGLTEMDVDRAISILNKMEEKHGKTC